VNRTRACIGRNSTPQQCGRACGRAWGGAWGGGGFTLVELLVSIAIIVMLLTILLPSLGYTIAAARGFRCQMSLRSVSFDFSVFADDQLHGDRGDDMAELGSKRFRLETFQESQYGLDEFWRWQGTTTHQFPDNANNDPMRCSELRGIVVLQNNLPCTQGGITPPQNISYTFNSRLHRAERQLPNGVHVLVPVTLSSAIMEHGRVPLVWDVDGVKAHQSGITPVFSAPAANSQGPYASGIYWFPANRHARTANFAFIDGSVASSRTPLQEPDWKWSFQPSR
jgi:prepilin-type N-terminal cleavage/methylation domain-containing protein/prepilin-type processing-associated H-X9-DG protein